MTTRANIEAGVFAAIFIIGLPALIAVSHVIAN
jgi:hypothetical protein